MGTRLGRAVIFEMLTFGNGGRLPLILYPTSFGRYYQNKDFGRGDSMELLARHAAVLFVEDYVNCSGALRAPEECDGHRPPLHSLRVTKEKILLGAHMSIGGGVHTAIERGCSIKCTAIQMFVKNNMQWFARPLAREEIRAFLEHRQRGQLLSIFAHANYLINLAATNPQFLENSIRALSEELIRADQLELPFLVLHPGAHLGAGEEVGLNKIVDSINRVFRKIQKVKTRIALETTAGQGSCLGYRFEQIAYIMENVRQPERLCVCLDTAHVFAAGYDIGTEAGVKKTFREFDRVIGLNRLAAIHVNDSKTVRGSRVDRHQHIGKGQIGLDTFRFIMRDGRFRKIAKVLETPKSKAMREDVANLKTLRRLVGRSD